MKNQTVKQPTYTILEELEVIQISNTQEIRVLLIRDERMGVKVSLQKWWRASEDTPWNVGKGFLLDGRQSYKIGKALESVGRVLALEECTFKTK